MYLYRKVLVLSLLMMSLGLANEIVIEGQRNNNAPTINHEVVIHQSLDGRDIYEDILGGTEIQIYGSLRMRGTMYTMTTDRYLIEQEAYLSIDESTRLHFVVYECDLSINNCELISETIIDDSGTGQGYYSSGDINIFLENGNTYAIGYAFEGNVGYGGEGNQNTSFGTWADCIYDSAVEYYPPPDNFEMPASGGTYNARLFTSDDPINDDSGCMDPYACNYDPDAIEDDGSCAYEEDCAGECGGDAVVDDCGVCEGDNADMDCADECFGDAVEDCAGECGGGAEEDDCGVCEGGNEDMDCAGECFGYAVEDCTGECGGDAVDDSCGECGGDDSSCTGCADPDAINYNPDATMDGCCLYYDDVSPDVFGDLNGDGNYDVVDVILLVNLALGID